MNGSESEQMQVVWDVLELDERLFELALTWYARREDEEMDLMGYARWRACSFTWRSSAGGRGTIPFRSHSCKRS